MTADDLRAFERRIADLYAEGKIHAPVHLRSGREQKLIDIFEQENIGLDDWVFAYWDSHEICLLKGVPEEELEKAILDGRSISLCFPERRIVCSGMAGSLMGAAVGVAWAVKQRGGSEGVYLFLGDMSAEMGVFHEAVKYAYQFGLPIKFIVCDNGLSVMTPTKFAWGYGDSSGPMSEPWFWRTRYEIKIIHFDYKNGFPHSGIGRRVEF